MKKALWSIIVLAGLSGGLQAQQGMLRVDGQLYPYIIDDCGDTLIVANLNDISISSFRSFDNPDDYLRYRRYRAHAVKVYPYAVEAIKLFREVEYATQTMKERERKKYIKHLHKDLKEQFTDPLKSLSRTQGLILIKMIEREVDTPLYELIKELRSGLTASYWNTLGSLFGHDLKTGYHVGEDRILDAVLQDMDISYSLPDRKWKQ